MKKALTLLLSLAMLFSLAACGQSGGDSTDDAPSTLVYGSADYTRIDPAMDEHCEINLLLFNGLTAHDGNDQIVPALAERWDYDEANCTYTFYLREGVKWHDGEPFTAQDVKFTIEAIMDPDNGSENAPNYEDVQEITVLDDHTVSFRLAEPNAAFLEYMTMAILPQHLLEGEDMQESAFFRAPVGTGPYKLESWDAGQSIVLVRNEDYFLGAPNIERVIFKIVPDDNAQAMQLESGEIDLALLDPKNAQNFAGKDGCICYDMTTADYRGILFNFANDYWTANRDIIPAICYAIDRQGIMDMVADGHGTAVGSSIYPAFTKYFLPELVDKYPHSVEKAKELLAQAGYPNGFDMTISVPNNYQPHMDTAEVVAEQLREAGINVTIQPVEWSTWLDTIYNGRQFQATVVGVDAANMTARAMLERFTSDYAKNFINYSNPAYDALFQQAINATDEATQTDLYKQMETMLADTAANVYIQDLSDLVAMRQDLGGLKFYPIYVLDLSTVYLTQQ